MRQFQFHSDEWKKVESPRRWRLEIFALGIANNASAVSVWEDVGPLGVTSRKLDMADVGISLEGSHVIKIESSHKFDGEIRVSY